MLGYGPIPVDKIGAPPRALFGEAGGEDAADSGRYAEAGFTVECVDPEVRRPGTAGGGAA